MSTYLVAFANGDFKYIESSYKSGLSGKERKLRIYSTPKLILTRLSELRIPYARFSATPDVIHQAQFALEVKRNCLPHYEKAFDVEFPLPKLDTLVVSSHRLDDRNCGSIAEKDEPILGRRF